jgi:type IV pilus assembly protein PilY1
MKTFPNSLGTSLRWTLVGISYFAAVASSAVTIPNQPLTIQPSAKPLIMLAMAKDHRLFYEAYNDASDIDGDGTLDIRFKPDIEYLGLFNSKLCYTHNNDSTNNGLFSPSGAGTAATITKPDPKNPASTITITYYKCPGSWSGNFLNYITTSRMDALRIVLYGGLREVDTTNDTILRRAYIPQDAHSWAKEYTDELTDGYKITDYTPLATPGNGRRHFFGNFTPNAGINCATLTTCTSLPPRLSIVTNSHRRVWEWASKERPVLNNNYLDNSVVVGTNVPTAALPTTRQDLTVRVRVCTNAFNDGCTQYPNNRYKPTGTLHQYADTAQFGLITGSYDNHMSGGRLRKVMSSFQNEFSTVTGVFTANATIVQTINALSIRGFNQGNTSNAYNGSVVGNAVATQGQFPDWGNPFGEIFYEAVRYLAGKGAATGAYTAAGNTIDAQVGLPQPNWDNPYSPTSTAKAPSCARGNILAISDTNISFDSDQLPGVNASFGGAFTTDLTGINILGGGGTTLNVSSVADFITANEPGIIGPRFIGQVGGVTDSAATAKNVTSLGNIRGLAPEEPTKRGSYYLPSVAHFAKVTDLQPALSRTQNRGIDSFFVALASPLLRIEAKLPNNKIINVLPFAKSVGGAFGISNTKTTYQPTNQIVDFYVESVANSGPQDANPAINGGRYQAIFRINFEDVEQGNDHDMDAIVEYVVRANADNTLTIQVRPLYEAGSVRHRMGYIISGTTADGTYLVVQDEADSTPYFLNVPAGRAVGYCDVNVMPADCNRLPFIGANATTVPNTSFSTITFTANASSGTSTASYLRDPMWYAAKWAGFVESDSFGANGKPDQTSEWDNEAGLSDGNPDSYFLVQNPTRLKEGLKKAFDKIIETFSSASNLATNSGKIDTNTLLYRSTFVSGAWSGELTAKSALAVNIDAAPATWTASSKLPPWQQRAIFMNDQNGVVDTRSTSFGALSTPTQAHFENSNDIYQYIRGNRSKEIASGGTLRDRNSALGDFIHSSPNFDPDYKTLFIGSNGGMLHAFDGETGVERFGMIPREVIPRLKNLSKSVYREQHEYFVDGDVSLSRRFASTNLSRYVLTQLGRGGKGLFALKNNQTSANPSADPTLLWEYTASGSTNLSTPTAASDDDLGLMLSPAFSFRVNVNGTVKYAFFIGNGYNSTRGNAVLYIFILNPDGSLDSVRKLDTGVGGDNGLAGPSIADVNGDGNADAVYAGDLKGNLWKFDISQPNPTDWKVAYNGAPMFVAVNPSGARQPITAPVYVSFDPVIGSPNYKKVFVFVGTGSYFKIGDGVDLSRQSMYAIIDNESNGVVSSRTQLRQRTITGNGTVTTIEGKVRNIRTFSPAVGGDMVGQRGWYIDLPTGTGERVVSQAEIVNTRVPGLSFSSIYPENSDPCLPAGDGYANFVDPFTGGQLQLDVLDTNGDGNVNATDKGSLPATQFASSVQLQIGIPTRPLTLDSNRKLRNLEYVSTLTEKAKSGTDNVSDDLVETDDACSGAACIPPGDITPRDLCEDKVKQFYNGSISQASLVLAGCAGSLRGRVSWREIIID